MTTTAAPPEHDFEQMRADVERRIGELHEQRQALAYEALSDPKAKAKLEEVERELPDAEAELGRVDLAAAEHERRSAEAAAAEAEAVRRAQIDKARDLQTKREEAAQAVQDSIFGFVESLSLHSQICHDQAAALSAAGFEHGAQAARPRGFPVEGALAAELGRMDREAREQHGHRLVVLERMPHIGARHRKPFDESDWNPVEKFIPTDTKGS